MYENKPRGKGACLGSLALPLVLAMLGCGQDGRPGDGDGDAGGGAPGFGDGDASGGAPVAGDGGASGGAPVAGDGDGGAASGGSLSGDPPPEASCTFEDACGGDPEGQWTATSSCRTIEGTVDLLSLGLGCLTAEMSGELEVTGTLTLSSDGFVDLTSTTGTMKIFLEKECFDVGAVVFCSDVAGPLSNWGLSQVVCDDVVEPDDGCLCTGEVDQVGGAGIPSPWRSSSGESATRGELLTLTDSRDRRDFVYSYCAEGDVLRLSPFEPSPFDPGPGEIVFARSATSP